MAEQSQLGAGWWIPVVWRRVSITRLMLLVIAATGAIASCAQSQGESARDKACTGAAEAFAWMQSHPDAVQARTADAVTHWYRVARAAEEAADHDGKFGPFRDAVNNVLAALRGREVDAENDLAIVWAECTPVWRRGDTPDTTTTTVQVEVSTDDLRVGDCVLEEPHGGRNPTVTRVDCGEPHRFQMYAQVELPKRAYPGEEKLAALVAEACTKERGRVKTSSWTEVRTKWLYPSRTSWKDGRRIIRCFVGQESDTWTGSALVESARG